MCPDCSSNTGSYLMLCLGCMARWILRFPKEQRLEKIESNTRHDIDLLKAELIKRAKGN